VEAIVNAGRWNELWRLWFLSRPGCKSPRDTGYKAPRCSPPAAGHFIARSLLANQRLLHAAYATYFNGFMTTDEKAALTHHHARSALQSLGVALPENYADNVQQAVADLINHHREIAGKPPL
jgi:hypothetical protein